MFYYNLKEKELLSLSHKKSIFKEKVSLSENPIAKTNHSEEILFQKLIKIENLLIKNCFNN